MIEVVLTTIIDQLKHLICQCEILVQKLQYNFTVSAQARHRLCYLQNQFYPLLIFLFSIQLSKIVNVCFVEKISNISLFHICIANFELSTQLNQVQNQDTLFFILIELTNK
ncbi:hypothetical protein BpHYR1_037277 [Brachionus plicatilis]|uniref:Uncharacterized protein n=1 Tax=Brachionus plicatilis TaxID=10195 RepID=A0A3M7QLU5_BRAPC|nr:hypothetical protein BpHYR1_037277 [Brachionus plicatilis]